MKAPTIDWAGLSPLLALLGGATIVLMLGLLRPRFVREVLVPLLTVAASAPRSAWASGSWASASTSSRARCASTS